jgi:predicted transcriptional regulator
MDLQSNRRALGISQSRLARLSGVSRFKICTYELGGGPLTAEEQGRVREAILNEANRLRSLPLSIDLGAQEEVR